MRHHIIYLSEFNRKGIIFCKNVSSESIEPEPEVILPCQLCEQFLPIKWKCMNCNIVMCDNCAYLHFRSKVGTDATHQIVNT